MSTLNVTTIIPDAGGSDVDLSLDGKGTGKVAIQDDMSVAGTVVSMPNLPTSDPGVAGSLWRDGTDLKVSTG
jgi:hypothetical protein